jgi:hypothetical protein
MRKLCSLFLIYLAFALPIAMVAVAAHAQSGVITGYGGTAQCYVLNDSVLGTPACVNRLSVACVVGNVGYVGGIGSYNGPITYPAVIPLFQRPGQSSVGVLTLHQLPGTAGQFVQVGLNGVLTQWVLSAPFTGQSCAPPAQSPRIDLHALARYCREHPTVPACRG